MESTSMVLTAPRELEARTYPVPEPGPEEAVLAVEMTSVCGSDIGLYTGKRDAPHPLMLGHEVVGRIEAAGEDAPGIHGAGEGDRVVVEPYVACNRCRYCHAGEYTHCEDGKTYGVTVSAEEPPHLWGGYGDYLYLPPNAKVHPVSEDAPAEAACLGSVVGNGIRWIDTLGDVGPADSVAVIGPGAQGLATTLVADEAGADPLLLVGLEADERRLDIGRGMGATHTAYVDAGDPRAEVAELTDGRGVDVAVVCAPAASAYRLAADLVAPMGRVVMVGLGLDDVSLDTDRLVKDEIALLGGHGQANEMGAAMNLVARRGEDVARIITHTFPVAEAETAIRRQLPDEAVFDGGIVHAALRP